MVSLLQPVCFSVRVYICLRTLQGLLEGFSSEAGVLDSGSPPDCWFKVQSAWILSVQKSGLRAVLCLHKACRPPII